MSQMTTSVHIPSEMETAFRKSLAIMEEMGLRVCSEEARDLFTANGCKVESDIVFIPESPFTKMKTGITSTVGQVKTAIENGINDAVSIIKSLPSQAISWGKDMIQGTVDGINAKLAEVKAAAKRVADAVKDVLGFSIPKEGLLHSYTELMPHFMQGIADGIEHNKYRVLNAMRDLASHMQLSMPSSPYPQTAGTVGVGGISQTINIYSPKALSPSETARKAKIAAQELALEWGV